MRALPLVRFHPLVHLERAKALTHNLQVEILDCIIISSRSAQTEVEQTLTWNVDYIQLIVKVERPDVYDISISSSRDLKNSVRALELAQSMAGMSRTNSYYAFDQFQTYSTVYGLKRARPQIFSRSSFGSRGKEEKVGVLFSIYKKNLESGYS